MYFVVERYVPGLSEQALREHASTVAALVSDLNARGCELGYHGSTALADEDVCFCLFSSPDGEEMEAVAALLGGRHERVTPAFHAAPTRED